MHRLHLAELAHPLRFTPAQKSAGRRRISRPRVLVPNVDGEEFEEAPSGLLPFPGDLRRQIQGPAGIPDDSQLRHEPSLTACPV